MNKLDCSHAMGNNAFFHHSGQNHFVTFAVPSPSVVYHGRKPTNLRVSLGAGAAQFQASGLPVRSLAGVCALASVIVPAHQLFFDPKR
jgi:hypothetical protein